MPQACEENIKDIGKSSKSALIISSPGLSHWLMKRKLPKFLVVSGRACGTLDRQTDEWLYFKNGGEPDNQLAHKLVVFKPIGDLVEDIINFSDSLKKVQFAYDSCPASVPESSENPNSYRPDGYFVLKTSVDDLGTSDAPGNPENPWERNLTLISEFKKAEGSRARNDVRDFFVRASRSDHP